MTSEIFRNYFLLKEFFVSVKETEESFEIFWGNSFMFKRETSNLIHYLADMCWNGTYTIMVLLQYPFWM
jgi:hypothetical protein